MKKYKTWEVIKMLTDKPYLRFENNLGSIITTSKKTKQIVWKSDESHQEDVFILFNHAVNCDNLHIDWVLVQQPVSFLEAIKAYAEGKTIISENPECRNNRHIYKNLGLTEALKDENYDTIQAYEILEWIWYIEEGEQHE